MKNFLIASALLLTTTVAMASNTGNGLKKSEKNTSKQLVKAKSKLNLGTCVATYTAYDANTGSALYSWTETYPASDAADCAMQVRIRVWALNNPA
ncbi:hypothetical protein [Pedobacter miscanthi]|uniref:hypothetical protein n=1 Tax=Pedobacter miscanthi TaxID=2259170 RepID=UPI00292E9AD0|nr:hypothetical protein [Pedobacter miscanthi]